MKDRSLAVPSSNCCSVPGVNITLNQISQLRERSRSSESENSDDIAQNCTDELNSLVLSITI
jgi:hypothetical protein